MRQQDSLSQTSQQSTAQLVQAVWTIFLATFCSYFQHELSQLVIHSRHTHGSKLRKRLTFATPIVLWQVLQTIQSPIAPRLLGPLFSLVFFGTAYLFNNLSTLRRAITGTCNNFLYSADVGKTELLLRFSDNLFSGMFLGTALSYI